MGNPAAPAPKSNPKSNPKSTKIMAEIRRCWATQIKPTARRPEFNWQFYEKESRILLGNASSPLQIANAKATASPTEAPERHVSAADVCDQQSSSTEHKSKRSKITENKSKRKKLTARKSPSYYYSAHYYEM